MKIGYVSSTKKGETDAVLSSLADALRAGGRQVAGIVRDQGHASRFENGCDMKVRVLPDGPVIAITQELGAGSGACRLDPEAIARSVALVEGRGLHGAELFILNKFGPEEAAGRGFREVIAAALDQGVPVLVGVGRGILPEFVDFAGEMATPLPADAEALRAWCAKACA